MKQKKIVKKLNLNRETISNLNNKEMSNLLGGSLYQSDCATCTTCPGQAVCRSIQTGCYPDCPMDTYGDTCPL